MTSLIFLKSQSQCPKFIIYKRELPEESNPDACKTVRLWLITPGRQKS